MSSLSIVVGSYTAKINVFLPGQVELLWIKGEKQLKNPPKGLKEKYPVQYQKVLKQYKSIKETSQLQKKRIENFLCTDRGFPYSTWNENYLLHPLLGSITSGLIWSFTNSKGDVSSIVIKDGSFRDHEGNQYTDTKSIQRVSLWHPVNASKQEHELWRSYIVLNSIKQPFRQAFREFYPPSSFDDMKLIISGLWVKQHQFRALLIKYDWRYSFRGSFENFSSARKTLESGYEVEITIGDESQAASNHGICLAVELDKIVFCQNGSRVNVKKMPKHLLSETLREIDLATSVSGIGYREDWLHVTAHFDDLTEQSIAKFLQSSKSTLEQVYYSKPNEEKEGFDSLLRVLAVLNASMERKPIPKTTVIRASALDILLSNTKYNSSTRIDGRYLFFDTAKAHYRINIASGLVHSMSDGGLVHPIKKYKKEEYGVPVNDLMISHILNVLRFLSER